MKKILLILLITIGSGCAAPVQKCSPLPLPDKPILPAITDAQLACLDKDTVEDIKKRDRYRKYYCEALEAVVKSQRGEK